MVQLLLAYHRAGQKLSVSLEQPEGDLEAGASQTGTEHTGSTNTGEVLAAEGVAPGSLLDHTGLHGTMGSATPRRQGEGRTQ